MSDIRRATLGEISISIVDGPFGSNLKTSDYISNGIPVLQGQNITNNTFAWSKIRFISGKKAEELARSKVYVGDHVLIKIGSIGYSAIIDSLRGYPFAIIPANMAKITPNKELIDTRYLHKWLTSERAKSYFVRVSSKTAQPALSLSKIKAAPIPLPSLPEQRRIAAILDKVDELRALRRQTLARLDDLAQSVFMQTASSGSIGRRVGDLCTQIRGVSYNKNEVFPGPIDGTFAVLRATNIENGSLLLDDLVYVVSERVNPIQLLAENDILIATSSGSIDVVGKAARVSTAIGMAFGAFCKVLRPNKEVQPLYFSYFFQSSIYKQKIKSLARGANINNLRNEDLNGLEMPLPPRKAQQKFTNFAMALERMKVKAVTQLQKIDEEQASIQQQFFSVD